MNTSLLYFIDNSSTIEIDLYYSEVISTTSSDNNSNSVTTEPRLNFTDVKNSQEIRNMYRFVIPVIGFFVIIINGLNVISSGLIIKKQVKPQMTYIFLGNVALCDLVTGIAIVFGAVFPRDQRTHIICSYILGLIVSSALASVWSIALIAIDRFLFIVHGIRYTQWVYESRARMLIISTWILGLTVGFLPAMGWETGLTNNGRTCWFLLLAPTNLIRLTVFFGLLPLVINVILYLIILYYALKKVIQLQNADKGIKTKGGLRISRGNAQNRTTDDATEQQSQQQTASKWKAIKVVLFTSGAFLITWGPYFICSCIYTSMDNTPSRKNLEVFISSPLAILGFVNSLLNPIIYAWWHKTFRKYTSIFLFRKKQPPKAQNTSSSTHSSKMSSSSKSNSVSSNPQVAEITRI